jgi:hypothetical protein
MKTIIHFRLGCVLVHFASAVSAAETWTVPAERIEVSSPAQKYKVVVTTDEKRRHTLTAVSVVWNGVQMDVPASDLVGLDRVRVESLKVITDRPMRDPNLPILNNRDLAVQLDFGEQVTMVDKNGVRTKARSRVFFDFTKFGYGGRDRHIPMADTADWRLYGNDAGKPEYSNGTHTGAALDSPVGWPTSERERSDDEY